ncbi:FAD-dependent oxidoreductase [Azospirillum sp. A26]|uniref:NAD(P)/FAD-dependent oxidoreductase n=1 Tax=Azospirillum sp. A26 TaxID=3160607 RepID=UPI003671F3BA
MTNHSALRQPLLRIQTDSQLPSHVDVAIIGAGIVGITAAYYLAKKRLSVLVLEKGIVGGEQSSRNWGWCRQLGRDPKELALMRRSIDCWQDLQKETGRDLGFRQGGSLIVLGDNAREVQWRAWQQTAAAHGVESTFLKEAEIRARLPDYEGPCVGGVTVATDGHAEPERAAPLLASAARDLGVRILQNCAVRLLDMAGGRVTGVITEKGRVSANAVVCAGGAWSGMLMRRHGIGLPQGHVHGSAMTTAASIAELARCVSTPTVSSRIRSDGGLTVGMNGRGTVYFTPTLLRHAFRFLPLYMHRRKWVKLRVSPRFLAELLEPAWGPTDISPFERTRTLDPQPDMQLIRKSLQGLIEAYPAMSGATPKYAWAGVIDSLPDLLPVISAVDQVKGLYLSTGFSGHGFGIAPAAGELIADLITGATTKVDGAAFGYSRLIDGTKLQPNEM